MLCWFLLYKSVNQLVPFFLTGNLTTLKSALLSVDKDNNSYYLLELLFYLSTIRKPKKGMPFPFCKHRNWGSENSSTLSKFTKFEKQVCNSNLCISELRSMGFLPLQKKKKKNLNRELAQILISNSLELCLSRLNKHLQSIFLRLV